MNTPLPVHLITGLLGSGKTTTLRQLIAQKPEHERWGVIINEFGAIDIDGATLKSGQNNRLEIAEVAGGCLCCSAQFGLIRAIHDLMTQPIDRLWIEPTGLGHPANLLDTLKQTAFARPLSLQALLCVITPAQLTPERWQKSAVMRDLVTLADVMLLNKTDQATTTQIDQARSLLQRLYPPKTAILSTHFGQIPLAQLTHPRCAPPLILLQGVSDHQHQLHTASHRYLSILPGVQHCQCTVDADSGALRAIGWIFDADVQFNRVQLRAFFDRLTSKLLRAKGLLKTGKQWQLLNWADQTLQFSDIAWRQDSRLELILAEREKPPISTPPQNPIHPKDIEIQLLSSLHLKNKPT